MRSMISLVGYSVSCGLLLLSLGGCVSSTSGNAALTGDKVNTIKKGVTTRREIEEMFGPPEMVTMMGGGRHIMNYSFGQTTGHVKPLTYVPIVGMFAGGSESQVEMRSLQVTLNPSDVVEDFQFNDSTTAVDRGGAFGTSTTATPVSSQNQSP